MGLADGYFDRNGKSLAFPEQEGTIMGEFGAKVDAGIRKLVVSKNCGCKK